MTYLCLHHRACLECLKLCLNLCLHVRLHHRACLERLDRGLVIKRPRLCPINKRPSPINQRHGLVTLEWAEPKNVDAEVVELVIDIDIDRPAGIFKEIPPL